jgi:hypothetical protein
VHCERVTTRNQTALLDAGPSEGTAGSPCGRSGRRLCVLCCRFGISGRPGEAGWTARDGLHKILFALDLRQPAVARVLHVLAPPCPAQPSALDASCPPTLAHSCANSCIRFSRKPMRSKSSSRSSRSTSSSECWSGMITSPSVSEDAMARRHPVPRCGLKSNYANSRPSERSLGLA